MPEYIVNKHKRDGRYHEVHIKNAHCDHYPLLANQQGLGWHRDCRAALDAANTYGYRPADGCFYCCKACHKG